MENNIKIAIFLTLLIVIAGFYYLIIVLPKNEVTNLEIIDERLRAQTQSDSEEETTENILIRNCLASAEETYRKEWGGTCEDQIKKMQGCIKDGILGIKNCEKLYGTEDNSYNCPLPSSMVDELDSLLIELKDTCFEKYSQ